MLYCVKHSRGLNLKHLRIALFIYFDTEFIGEKSGSAIWIGEYEAQKRRWIYEDGDILGITLVAETISLRIKHARWLILRGVKLFFVYFDLMARIYNCFQCLALYYGDPGTTICCESPDGMSIWLMSRSRWPCGLGLWVRPLGCWNCELESHRGRGCHYFVIVVYYQLEVFASGRSLARGSPTDFSVSEWYFKRSWKERLLSDNGPKSHRKKKKEI
jgi:hypothetical protein